MPASTTALPPGAASALPTSMGPSPSLSVSPSATHLPGASASTQPGAAPGGNLVAGNPAGRAAVPATAATVDTSHPTRVVGSGTPASCTSAAVVAAVAAGGVITFSCGPNPVTITMTATARVVNAAAPQVVIDGGGLVTLNGAGRHRILYMDTCDKAQGWTTSHCDDQETPSLTVQNLTFANGNSTGDTAEGGGGGAILVRGGQFKIVHSAFVANTCDSTGPDLGGAAVRVLDQYQDRPVYVVSSTFTGGSCSNGGALSSIGVSWTVLNSVFRNNKAIGRGANPASSGTPGGGSGGAIYNDGNQMALRIAGSIIENNSAVEGGGGVFFVSNNKTGTLVIENSTLRGNPSAGFETSPGIYFNSSGKPSVTGSTIS
ncbi:hypothetical protein I6A60_06040 [Frankia sp. AgB1.9]|uniref:hypothetical protein n=1 Tax=unclassified Frankia TaxID=2632575 RepID=UPI00193341A0|nr:hypothetical protein [Frankia sp. AgW1.1]MBL7487479.1 hypothetical protein [Frankia sp. AgW1.1]MBL7547441.1 hypothetical protein [Frankia sp. AgB1.9]MBL7618784.1 hypothetical protein [Frankia sp. AgB1.8]